jgi:ABC-type Fe3+ transport system permease subunit
MCAHCCVTIIVSYSHHALHLAKLKPEVSFATTWGNTTKERQRWRERKRRKKRGGRRRDRGRGKESALGVFLFCFVLFFVFFVFFLVLPVAIEYGIIYLLLGNKQNQQFSTVKLPTQEHSHHHQE